MVTEDKTLAIVNKNDELEWLLGEKTVGKMLALIDERLIQYLKNESAQAPRINGSGIRREQVWIAKIPELQTMKITVPSATKVRVKLQTWQNPDLNIGSFRL